MLHGLADGGGASVHSGFELVQLLHELPNAARRLGLEVYTTRRLHGSE